MEKVHLYKCFVQPGGMWGLPWGLLCGTSGRKDLCMVPCHSCHIYGIWISRSKKMWRMIKSHQFVVAMQVTKGAPSIGKAGSPAVLWNFIASLTAYILWKNLLDTSFHYTTIALRVWGWKSQKCNSKYSNENNTEWAIPEKFSSFLLYPWKFHILNPPSPSLSVCFFPL